MKSNAVNLGTLVSRSKIDEQLIEMAQAIKTSYRDLSDLGVLGGLSGTAVFQFEYYAYSKQEEFLDNAIEIIEYCVNLINNGYNKPTYCDGLAGFGWTLQFLRDKEYIDFDCNELLKNFDHYLGQQMKVELEAGNFDYLHGALGYGQYFLKRYKSLYTSSELKKRYKEYLLDLLNGLQNIASVDKNMLQWESLLDYKTKLRG